MKSGQDYGCIKIYPDAGKLFIVENIIDRRVDDKVGTFYLLNMCETKQNQICIQENAFWV